MRRLAPWACFLVFAVAALVALRTSTLSPRSTDGSALFAQRCAVCHSITTASGSGPGLGGVAGRKAGSLAGFGYSHALRDANLVWDDASLDRFLQAPGELVPGTMMAAAVTDAHERGAIVSYLTTLEAHPGESVRIHAPSSPGDFEADVPGRRRRLRADELPQPYASESARNSPLVVARPEGAAPRVLAGFSVHTFATLEGPRQIRVAPSGDVFVAESALGRVRVLRAPDGADAPTANEVFASGLDRPFGIAFYPLGPDPTWVYIANTDSVVRFPYHSGDLHARGAPETIIPRLASEGGHWTRDLVFSPGGTTLFVSVGSASNVAEQMPARPASETAAWDSSQGLGAGWGAETDRADVLSFTPEGQERKVFAAGIRNCVGMATQPVTGALWCSTNERDGLGDNLVPDYLTHITQGAFYGWPWYYLGAHPDPRHTDRPDLASHVTVPDVLVQAHSASLGMTFYDAPLFPSTYRGDAFAAFHGSWNRATRTGPKVVHLLFHDGVPTGDVEDFMTGFVVDEESVWARPVGVAVAHDGALLVTEDGNGTVWRITPAP